jgi:hypothetical protein
MGVKIDDMPTIRAISPKSMTKYVYDGNMSVEAIGAFIDGISTGNVKPSLKSESPPKTDTNPVKVLVGQTFEKTAYDPSMDVFVYFYAPQCVHCE